MSRSVAGIDWASEKHDVLIADVHGERLLAGTFAHDEQGITALCDALLCFDVEVVAIERGDGVLVERLLEAGVRVLALHPNQVKAARDRFRASGGKSGPHPTRESNRRHHVISTGATRDHRWSAIGQRIEGRPGDVVTRRSPSPVTHRMRVLTGEVHP